MVSQSSRYLIHPRDDEKLAAEIQNFWFMSAWSFMKFYNKWFQMNYDQNTIIRDT